MKFGEYELDVIVSGYPGKSTCHGSLGWSTIALLRGAGRIAVVDGGGIAMRDVLCAGLRAAGIAPSDVTDVLLTHSHYDHAVNWVLFPSARIVIARRELEYAAGVPWGETPVAELYAERLATWSTLVAVEDGDEVMPGVICHHVPGHTPGCLIYIVTDPDRQVIFSGDAVKDRAELLGGRANMTLDDAASTASIERIDGLFRRRPGNVLVPGHDLPMVVDGVGVSYLGTRKAGIVSWLADDLADTMTFDLAG